MYDDAPKQSMFAVMAVLMRKHLILGWRRKRIIGATTRVAYTVAVPLVIWFLQRDEEQRENVRGTLVASIMPMLGAIFIVTMFTQFVVEIVTDKELKMRYVQQIAGASDAAYWCSYYLYYLLVTTFGVVLYLICVMELAPLYKHSSPLLMFLSYSAAFLQAFFLSMMVATVFARARMAAVVCSMTGALLVGVFFVLLPLINTQSSVVYFLESLIPFVSPLNLLNAIGTLENPSTAAPWGNSPPGFTWSSWSTPISSKTQQWEQTRLQPPAGVQFWILVIDCVIYGFFATWFDQVYQGEFGAAKPWNFCFKPAFMCPNRRQAQTISPDTSTPLPALSLMDLVKVFGTHRAVDGMSLEVRRSEIFALLGHNGAGKTTAINCITGMLPMTSGSVQVCGFDVSTQLQAARRYVSVCPQDNPLYPEYTVDGHLLFFAALRGVPMEAARVAIDSSLEALGLTEKRNARVVTLSGGQKRRLWVATSLLGHTPVVFLDEPTSGMDPANRRKLWDLLVHMKNLGRCILFTTHYLDEADLLAERKAVLDKGKVRAVGTSMQLKREFGVGYHLRIVCSPGTPLDTQGSIGDLVRSYIPSASDESSEDCSRAHDAAVTWSFILPYDQTDHFGPVLLELERRAPELQIVDCSMEMTSLEEVFMALGQAGGGASATDDIMMQVVVPPGYTPSQPYQVHHPETQALITVTFPPGAREGETHNVAIPRPVTDMELASPSARMPVTWWASTQAVCMLRWRQVVQNRRSLIATFIVPILLLFLNGWGMARQLKKLDTADIQANIRDISIGISGASAGLWMSISLSIALPYFATALVLDRVQRCTYVATSQGLRTSAYWVGTFMNNYLHFLFLALLIPVCVLVFQAPFYSNADTVFKYLPASLYCPIPMLLFAYSMSRLFSSAEACSKFMPGISLMASVIPFLAVYIMTILSVSLQISALPTYPGSKPNQTQIDQGKSLHFWANLIHWSMSFIDPFYCLPGTFAALGLTQLTDLGNNAASLYGVELDLLFPSLGGSYIAVPLIGAIVFSIFCCVFLAWDMGRTCGMLAHRFQRTGNEDTTEIGALPQRLASFIEDTDVCQEERRVMDADPSTQAVLFKNLIHTYGQGSRREVRAVRGISLGVSPGECFCLLGPNGAGKTTTLDVLTGAIFPPTQGEVSIGGHAVTSSREDRRSALAMLGNCPQVDPLWPTLTGRQHLLFYAKIKGLPPSLQAGQVAVILRAMGFSDFDADKPTSGYSGGMKRKLSLAIALIGSPPTMLLDEPSAAVDAAAKRHLWRVVKRREQGQTVILTTHSMEEAEALSDRLAIQVRGRLRCVGTPDHIKNTHGAGYQLEMLMAESGPSSAAEEFVSSLCSSARLIECHESRYVFQLPTLRAIGAGEGELSLATLFTEMQDAMQAIGLRDYSISRPSLEQVFLRFSKEQQDLEENANL